MDDRSTLERAFEHISFAHEASRGLIRLSAPDREVELAIRRTQALLGRLLAEEMTGTAWTRWKSATCDLVNWWAARLMRALYIRPVRVCLQNVHVSSHSGTADAIVLPDHSVSSVRLAKTLIARGIAVEFPLPYAPLGKSADERTPEGRRA